MVTTLDAHVKNSTTLNTWTLRDVETVKYHIFHSGFVEYYYVSKHQGEKSLLGIFLMLMIGMVVLNMNQDTIIHINKWFWIQLIPNLTMVGVGNLIAILTLSPPIFIKH